MQARLVFCVLIANLLALRAWAEPLPACPMQPTHLTFDLPLWGFVEQKNAQTADPLDPSEDVPASDWTATETLSVHVSGPEGSGRFWTVFVGVSDSAHTIPTRGICLSTYTVGWRTFQQYSKGALPWLDDLDRDGRSEFILWDSFPLHPDASLARYAVIAWVYRFTAPNTLEIDWPLTQQFARVLIAEYLAPLPSADKSLHDARSQAAKTLGDFVEGRCALSR